MKKRTIVYILFIAIFTIIAGELVSRYYIGTILEKSFNRKFQFSQYRVYEHVPNFKEGDEEGNWIVINKNGFRRTQDVDKEKPKDLYRVFLLGGSAAHGISSSAPYPIRHIYQDETIDAYLEQQLKSKFPQKKIEVINAAVTGYQVFQHTQYIITELLDYSPDLIIFFDGINDHYQINYETDYHNKFLYQFWKDKLQNPSIISLFDYFALLASDYSAMFRGYYDLKKIKVAGRNRNENTSKSPNTYEVSGDSLITLYKMTANKGFLRSMRSNLTLLKTFDIDAILCLQPILALRDSTLISKQEDSFLHVDKGFIHHALMAKSLYPSITSDIKKLANEFDVPYVDYIPVFNSQEYKNQQLLIDYCHLNPLGGEVVADTLNTILSKHVESYFDTNN